MAEGWTMVTSGMQSISWFPLPITSQNPIKNLKFFIFFMDFVWVIGWQGRLIMSLGPFSYQDYTLLALLSPTPGGLIPRAGKKERGMLDLPWLAVELREWFASTRSTFLAYSLPRAPIMPKNSLKFHFYCYFAIVHAGFSFPGQYLDFILNLNTRNLFHLLVGYEGWHASEASAWSQQTNQLYYL